MYIVWIDDELGSLRAFITGLEKEVKKVEGIQTVEEARERFESLLNEEATLKELIVIVDLNINGIGLGQELAVEASQSLRCPIIVCSSYLEDIDRSSVPATYGLKFMDKALLDLASLRQMVKRLHRDRKPWAKGVGR